MRNLFHRYANRYFLTITISSFLPLAILLLLILAASFSVYDYEMKKRSLSSFEERLDSYASQTDLKYRRIKYLANQLSVDYNITNWLRSDDVKPDLYQLWLIQRDMNAVITANSGIFSIDLFNRRNNIILSTYSGFWHGSGGDQLPDSVNSILVTLNETSNRVSVCDVKDTYTNKKLSTLGLICPLPLNGRLGALSINIQLEGLVSYPVNTGEFLFLTDLDNSFLYAPVPGNIPGEISGDDMLCAVTEIKKAGNVYKTSIRGINYLVSYQIVFDGNFKLASIARENPSVPVNHGFTGYFVGAFIVVVLLSFSFSVFIYKTARRPLKQIVENVKNFMSGAAGEAPTHDEINYLNISINSLISKNNEAEKVLRSYKGVLIETTLRDLIFGKRLDQTSVSHNAVELFDEKESSYLVLIFNMDKMPVNYDETHIGSFFSGLFEDVQKKYKGYYLRTGLKNYTFVACLKNRETVPELVEFLRQVQNTSLLQHGVELSAGVSAVKDSPEELNTAYNEALDALKCKVTLGNGQIVIYAHNIETDRTKSNYFPVEEGQVIINKLRTAGENEIEETLSGILDIKARTYSIELLHAFLLYIASCIAKVAVEYNLRPDDISSSSLFDMINNFETIEEKKSFLLKQCIRIIEARNNAQKLLKKMSIEIVVQYIEKRYSHPLSLTNIADDLHISASYLSNLIKRELGVSFLAYLNNLRMEKAVSLLRNDRLTVKEITSMVGYDSEHSFIRNFKKIYNKTPSEYRNQIYRELSTLMKDGYIE